MKARSLLIPLLVIFLLALMIRLYPLAHSPYPYNIDGLGEAMLADGIYRTGSLETPPDAGYEGSYIVQMPLMAALAAAVADFVGTEPLLLLQPLTAVIGALSCVIAALAVHMITGNRRISVMSGMFLALLGTFVFCTSSAWKETLGLALMLLIMGLYLRRGDIRFRLLMTAALVMLVFVHHHSAVLTFLIVTFAIACECNKAMRGKKWRWGNSADIATIAALWVLALGYYSAIDLPYYHFLEPDTDLYLFIAVAAAMVLLMFTSLAGRWNGAMRRYLKMSIPAIAVGLIVLNYLSPLFPGLPGTESALLLFVLSYLLLVLPIWYGSEKTFIPGQGPTPLLLAALFAPLSMMLFGFLRALDPTSHMIIYRTFDFLDFGLALLFGAGVIIMIRNARKLAPVVVALFLLILSTTTPIAFQTEGLFGVQNYTYGYEVDSYGVIHSISATESIDSDQRIGTSIGWFYNLSCELDLAYTIEMGGEIPEDHWLLVESSWTTAGAQEFPLEPRVLDEAVFSEFLDGQNVLLIAGPQESQLIAAKAP